MYESKIIFGGLPSKIGSAMQALWTEASLSTMLLDMAKYS